MNLREPFGGKSRANGLAEADYFTSKALELSAERFRDESVTTTFKAYRPGESPAVEKVNRRLRPPPRSSSETFTAFSATGNSPAVGAEDSGRDID